MRKWPDLPFPLEALVNCRCLVAGRTLEGQSVDTIGRPDQTIRR